MADAKKLAPIILKWEGGFVNDPVDRGGATNRGITYATYKTYCKIKKLPEPTINDLINMSEDQWTDVYKMFAWDKWKADDIDNQSIANLVVDWTWGSGVWGIKFPQRILNVADDGIVGNITLSAINNYPDKKELFQLLWNRRKRHFEDIAAKDSSQNRFLRGWLNRLNDFKFE